jgi:Tfp pilus assembly protein PilO
MIIKILLFPVILLLVLYFIIAKVVPTAQAITTAKKQIEIETISLNKAIQQVQKAEAFEQEVQSRTQEKDFLMDFVPNNKKEEILISDISQLATSTNVNLFSIGFSAGSGRGVNSDKPQSLEGKMIVSGTYESIKQFMHQLFRIKRLYGFKTLDLTKIEQEKTEDGQPQTELMLSSVVSFSYDYIPGVAEVSPAIADEEINFSLIDTVMNAIATTQPLNTEEKYRANPFLP